jgi:hypothetical protein
VLTYLCDIAAGRPIGVICADRKADGGWWGSSVGNAVAAVCCCRMQAYLMLKCQTWPSSWLPCSNAMLASAPFPELPGRQGQRSRAYGDGAKDMRSGQASAIGLSGRRPAAHKCRTLHVSLKAGLCDRYQSRGPRWPRGGLAGGHGGTGTPVPRCAGRSARGRHRGNS